MSHIIVDAKDDEAVLEAVQKTRIKIANKIMLDGDVPTDKDGMVALQSLLNDMAGTALGRARVTAQTKANENQGELIKALIVGSMKQIGSNPFIAASQYVDGKVRDVTPTGHQPPGVIPPPPEAFVAGFEAVPGEMAVGLEPFIYSDFMEKTEHLDEDDGK